MIVQNGEYNPEKVAAAMDDLGMKDKAQAERETFGLVEGHTINAATPIPPDPDGKRRLVKQAAAQQESEKEETLLDFCLGKQPPDRLTVQLLEVIMATMGLCVKHNVITQEIEIDGKTDSGRRMDYDDLITTLHSSLTGRIKGCTADNLIAYTAMIAKEHQYNPILELLQSTKWDKKNRLPEVFELLGIDEDLFSCALVTKWLFQGVALLYNDIDDPFGAEGVLVLNGPQSAGKTSFFHHLAIKSKWFMEGGQLRTNDKDTKRRILTHWITELGEVESTFRKSDTDELKALVTNSVDEYRIPYARHDRQTVRRTNLCATCNSERYLVDQTGNRRWWSIPITKPIDFDGIQQLDALQLWAQINEVVSLLSYKEKAACFRLSREELETLEIRNGGFSAPLPAEEECRDILTAAEAAGPRVKWRKMTVTDWIALHPVLRSYSSNQVGCVLKRLGFEQDRSGKSRGYILPDFFTPSMQTTTLHQIAK